MERIGYNERNGSFGLAVAFEKFVQTTISDLQVGPKTLLTRFGGIVGVDLGLHLFLSWFSARHSKAIFANRNHKIKSCLSRSHTRLSVDGGLPHCLLKTVLK